jgi:hypothetical protein
MLEEWMASTRSRRAAGALLLAAAALGACNGDEAGGGGRRLAASGPGGIDITPAVPVNLTESDLASAATFAWNEFIALNWPAVPQNAQPNTRGFPDTSKLFGDTTYHGPLVWHTFRSKIEIFPVPGSTPNGYDTTAVDYGYDAAPQYTYQNSYGQSGTPPWINLDENDEIGLTAMYAGVASGVGYTNGLILFTAKANRQEYRYAAGNRFFDATYAAPAKKASAAYVTLNSASPPAGNDSIASLPDSTIEIKAAWRALGPNDDSTRFYRTTVRYYRSQTPGDTTFVDTTFALVALHIIQKTPNQPHFVFATFEQADNILSATGARVEDENGNLNAGFASLSPTAPVVTSTPGSDTRPSTTNPDSGYSRQNIQQLGPPTSDSVPGSRLYYRNTPDSSSATSVVYYDTEGPVAVNRRVHPIPQTVIDANVAAHAAMAAYAQENNLQPAVWQYYKLVNVQYTPLDKPAGQPYTGADSSTYYLANSVVETNHNLQVFSGQFQPGFTGDSAGIPITVNYGTNLITDWCGYNTPGLGGCQTTDTPRVTINGPFHNVRYSGTAYNMGGCMGCHGNAQLGGADFSFLLLEGNNTHVQTGDPDTAPLDNEKYLQIFAAARAAPTGQPAGRPASRSTSPPANPPATRPAGQ